MLNFLRKAMYDVFNEVCLSVSGFFEGKLSGLGELLMELLKIGFECNPYFLDRRKAI